MKKYVQAAAQADLNGVAEICTRCSCHHGQESCARPDVQNNCLLTSLFYSAHCSTNTFVILCVLWRGKNKTNKNISDLPSIYTFNLCAEILHSQTRIYREKKACRHSLCYSHTKASVFGGSHLKPNRFYHSIHSSLINQLFTVHA